MSPENSSHVIPAEFLAGMLGGVGDGVILTDLDEKVIYLNQSAKRIIGWENKSCAGLQFSAICPLVNLRTGAKYINPLAKVVAYECSVGLARNVGIYRGKKKEKVYLSATCSPAKNNNGEIIGCLAILRDVTKLRQMEIKIATDHVYMRSVFAAANIGLCVLDNCGAIIDMNDAGLKTMQIGYQEAIGEQFGDAFRCENSFHGGCGQGKACKKCPVRRNIEAIIKGEPFERDITVAMHSLYKTDPIWLKMFFSQAGSGIGRQIVVAMIDVSARKEREEALNEARDRAEAASRTKTQFLANMSHEIRTPINGMTGMIDLTLRTELTAEQRENLTNAKQCAEDLLMVINDILDFSKLECGKMELENIDFDLHKTLHRVCSLHFKMAKAKGLYFKLPDYTKIPHYITGDPTRLRQILHNLLTNAIKFTAMGGISVAVKVRQHADKTNLVFAVRDTGIGMSLVEQRKIFHPFSQVDGSTTRKFGGTGLGLMIVKSLVEAMHGDVGVRSAPACGSEFYFWLPLREADGESENMQNISVYVNPKRGEDLSLAAENNKVDDIASLLAYCEKKMEE